MEGLVVEVVVPVEEAMVVEALGFEVDILEMEALMTEGLMVTQCLSWCHPAF